MSKTVIFLITLVVAFCSIVYELILGQALSAFLGNTILRYSVTIGLYLFAMGFGAMIAEGKFTEKTTKTFVIIELLLTLLGGFSIFLLFFIEHFFGSNMIFFLASHGLIIVIGILTGFEIPLLIEIGEKNANIKEETILGVDYIGAFVGAITFSFLFYQVVGLVLTAFFVAFLNGLAGMTLFFGEKASGHEKRKRDVPLFLVWFQVMLVVVLVVCMLGSQKIGDLLMENYLSF